MLFGEGVLIMEKSNTLNYIIIPLMEDLSNSEFQYNNWVKSLDPEITYSYGECVEDFYELYRLLDSSDKIWGVNQKNRADLILLYQEVKHFHSSVGCKTRGEHGLDVEAIIAHPEWKKTQEHAANILRNLKNEKKTSS